MSLGLFVLRVIHLSVSVFVILLRVPFLSPTCESLHCASFIYLFPSHVTRIVCLACHSSICLRVRHPVARPLSTSYLRVIALRVLHLFVSAVVILLIVLARPLSVACARFCFVVHRGRRGEEGGSDSLASWEDKRIDMVASSWRYFSTQSIISLHRPILLPSVKRRCDHPNNRTRRACRRSIAIKERKTERRPLTGRTYAVAPTSPLPVHRG
jgi:hypothetical protein